MEKYEIVIVIIVWFLNLLLRLASAVFEQHTFTLLLASFFIDLLLSLVGFVISLFLHLFQNS